MQGFGPMPEKVVHICCGQFAATRNAIQTRSQEFYQEALLFMRPENNDIRGNHHTSRQYVIGVCAGLLAALLLLSTSEHASGLYSDIAQLWHSRYGRAAGIQMRPRSNARDQHIPGSHLAMGLSVAFSFSAVLESLAKSGLARFCEEGCGGKTPGHKKMAASSTPPSPGLLLVRSSAQEAWVGAVDSIWLGCRDNLQAGLHQRNPAGLS